MAMTDSFQTFIKELSQRIQIGENMGISESEIQDKAVDIGNWLAEDVDPNNPEQRLLKELWSVAGQKERQSIASCLFKLADQQKATV